MTSTVTSTVRGTDTWLGFHRPGWMWLLAGLTLGLACGLGSYFLAQPIYRATVAVEVSEVAPTVTLGPSGQRPEYLTVDTDAHVITSDAVITAIAEATDEQPAQVRAHLGIAARPLTRIVEISYAGSSPAKAAVGAEQAARTFLAERERLVLEPVEDYLGNLASQTQDPTPAGDALAIANLATPPQVRPENLRARAVAARVALPGSGSVLEHARVLASPDRGDAEVPLASGAALGALLGLGFGLARDARRRRQIPAGRGTA